MRQSLGNIEEFILLVKNRPALYNFNLNEFNDKNLTTKLWEEIAREFNTNVDYCKTKWGTLRVSFARQMRNEKTNAKNKSENLINDWYLKDHMSFMRDYMRKRKNRKYFDNESENEIENENDKNDSLISKSNLTIKTENNLSNSSLEIKSEPIFDNDNESLVSLDLLSNNEDFLEVNKGASDGISIASSSVSNCQTQTIENQIKQTIKTYPGSNSEKKRKATSLEQDDQSLKSLKKRKSNRKCKLSFKRKSNEAETDSVLLAPRENKEEEQQGKLSSTSPSTNPSTTQVQEIATMTFFKSILPDFNKLTERRQRLLKQNLMEKLNTLLDEQENES